MFASRDDATTSVPPTRLRRAASASGPEGNGFDTVTPVPPTRLCQPTAGASGPEGNGFDKVTPVPPTRLCQPTVGASGPEGNGFDTVTPQDAGCCFASGGTDAAAPFALPQPQWDLPASTHGGQPGGRSSVRHNGRPHGPASPPAVTTLMICNVPREITPEDVGAEMQRLGFASTYDILHLVSRGPSGKNRDYGYGFVNFRRPEDAEAFKEAFNGYRFEGATNSPCGISLRAARVQGFLESVRLLARSEEKHGLRGYVMFKV